MAKIEINDVSAMLRNALDEKSNLQLAKGEMPFKMVQAALPASYLPAIVADPAAAARAAGIDVPVGARVETRIKQKPSRTESGSSLVAEIVIIIIEWPDGSIDIIIILP